MKKSIGRLAPVFIAAISMALVNCGDDGGGGGASAPSEPTNPYPGANATNVATNTVLAWECTDADGSELTFDVYMGTGSDPPLVAENISPPYYVPADDLNTETKYYWKVVAKDGSYATGGPTWSFATAAGSGGGGGGGGGGEEPKSGNSKLMPLSVGNKWVYNYVRRDEEGIQNQDEYEILVVDKFDNYHGYEAYLVKTKWLSYNPYVTYEVFACDGDKFYRFTSPWWEFVIEDDMEWMSWSQTGLMTSYKLQFNFVKNVNVPAGNFKDCKQLSQIIYSGNYSYTYEECYAEGVGLVYYKNRSDYSSTNWDQSIYKLKSYHLESP
ncbi:MAG: hypothetical protein PVH29_02650 [Candidatus Zixiibacteriota bacterium]